MALFQFPRGQRQNVRQNNGYQNGGSMFSFSGRGGQNQGYGMNPNQRVPPNIGMGQRQPGNFQNPMPFQGQQPASPPPMQNQTPPQPQEPLVNSYDPSISLRPVYGPEDLYKMPPSDEIKKSFDEKNLLEEAEHGEMPGEKTNLDVLEEPALQVDKPAGEKPYDVQNVLKELVQNEYNAKVFYGHLSQIASQSEFASIMQDVSKDNIKACQICQELLLSKYSISHIPEERPLVNNISFRKGIQMGIIAESSAIRDFIQLKETLANREKETVDSIIQLKFISLSLFQMIYYTSS